MSRSGKTTDRPSPGFLLALVLASTLIPFRLSAAAREPQETYRVEPASDAALECGPRAAATAVFRVVKSSPGSETFSASATLPEGWSLLAEEPSFSLSGGDATVRLITFAVPPNARAGRYRVAYSVRAAGNPQTAETASIEVVVPLRTGLDLEIQDLPAIVIAGGSYQGRFLLVNRGNAPAAVLLDIRSGPGARCTPASERWDLDAGEARTLLVSVDTDPDICSSRVDRLEVKAESADSGGTPARASVQQDVEVIPRAGVESNGYHQLPLQFGILGVFSNSSRLEPQIGLSGKGSVDDQGAHRVDFLFRGLRSRSITQLFPWENEARFGYTSARQELHIGDRIFSMTRLTEFGRYRRGVDARLDLGPFMLRAAFMTDPLLRFRERQAAVQLGLRLAERASFDLSYLGNRLVRSSESDRGSLTAGDMFSLRTRITALPKLLDLDMEYARGTGRTGSGTSDGYWLEAFGGKSLFSYRVSAGRADAGFPGSYRGFGFQALSLSVRPTKGLIFSGSYNSYARDRNADSPFSASAETFRRAGVTWGLFRGGWLSLDYRDRAWTGGSPLLTDRFGEQTLRAGADQRFGPLNLNVAVDLGRTDNLRTGERARLVQYDAGASLIAAEWLSFGGNFQLRDQKEGFAGDRFNRISAGFRLELKSGRNSLSAMYRTAFRREFAEEIASGQDQIERLLQSEYDLWDVQLKLGLWWGHSFGLRVRGLARRGASGEKDMIGLAEYTIPLGVPVSRKKDLGALKGRVADAEIPGAGLAGVILRASGAVAVTDSEGYFCFNGLRPGRHVVNIDQTTLGFGRIILGELPIEKTIEGGVTAEADFLAARAAAVSGQIKVFRFEDDRPVVEGLSGSPNAKDVVESGGLSYAVVELEGGGRKFTRTSDGDGQFLFEDLRPGLWTLKVRADLPPLCFLEKDVFDLDLFPGEQEKALIRVLPKLRSVHLVDGGEVSAVEAVPTAVSRPAGPPPGAKLKDLIVRKAPGRLEVEIVTDFEGAFKSFGLSNPDRVVIDLYGVRSIAAKRSAAIGEFGIRMMRTAMFNRSTARVVFDLEHAAPSARVERTPAGLKVVFFEAQVSQASIRPVIR